MIKHSINKYITLFIILVGMLLVLSAFQNTSSSVPPAPIPDVDRPDLQRPGLVMLVGFDENGGLIPPVVPEEPTQLERGAWVYYQICLACHGDWGQGLTKEWRETWGDDMNCWQSRCHASNHPEEGFELVKYTNPVLGRGSLAGYKTAAELHKKIADTMPWWYPGSLTEEQAWDVTAYLLKMRGELPENVELNENNAPIIELHKPANQQAQNAVPEAAVMIFTVFFAFTTVAIFKFPGTRS